MASLGQGITLRHKVVELHSCLLVVDICKDVANVLVVLEVVGVVGVLLNHGHGLTHIPQSGDAICSKGDSRTGSSCSGEAGDGEVQEVVEWA